MTTETVETRHVLAAMKMAQSVMDSLETGPIGQLIGEPGTGKTRTGKALVERMNALRVCCMPNISNFVLTDKIYAALGTTKDRSSASATIGSLELLVAGRLLVVDEANHLRWQQLELLRYLADEAGMGLVLVGTDLMQRPFQDGRTATLLAQLASRIGAKRVRFEALRTLDEVTGYMIRPRFGAVSNATAKAFHKCARGYWRDASELATAASRVMVTQGIEQLTPEVVEAAANWMAAARQNSQE